MLVGSLQNQESIFAKSRIHLTIQTLARLHGRLGTVLPNFVEKLLFWQKYKVFTLIFNLQEVNRKAKRIVTAIGHETQQIFFVVVFKFD